MSDRFVEAFVEKLILLERKTGANVQYRIMPPFMVPFHDHLSIQKTAKDIAEFIGLTGFTFIVGVAKQREKVGGHIDLCVEGDNVVFVEIDGDMMKFPDAVGATLCHEVCHKWLQLQGIASPVKIENEILTDITSVFLGFGKIMLNGCKATKVSYETIPNGTRTITQTMASGYLHRDQLAFVYRLVCGMRNIPASDSMQGLNPEASQAVRACDLSLGRHYDSRFHRPETTQQSVEDFQSEIIDLQHVMADLDKHMVYTRKSFCETIDAFLTSSHKDMESLQQRAAAMTEETEADPALRFLRSIQKHHELNRMCETLRAVGNDSQALLRHARSVGRHLARNGKRFPAPTANMFTIVKCPKDGTKLRLPENSGNLIATCPSCKYRFAYNTAVLSFPEPTPAPARKPTLKTRIAKLFRR